MKTKIFTLLLALFASINLWAESGTCGPNLTWSLNNGVLTISGTGSMNDFIQKESPWYSLKSSITSIIIGNSVTNIGNGAFSYCSGLTSVSFGNSLTNIGKSAFYGCSSLTSITIPNGVTSIGEYAFCECIGLASVTIPNSITSIGNEAFGMCSSLTSVTIPNSVTSIGRGAFLACSEMNSINVESGNTHYDSRNNCNAIIETSSNTLIAGCKMTVIPNSVTSLGELAFGACSSLASVTIPNSVTSIGDGTFYGCSSLTSVTIPNSVTSIGFFVLSFCSEMNSINVESGNTHYDSRNNCNAIIETSSNTLLAGCKTTEIPNSVTSIGHGAFEGCRSLISVTIPNGVTSLGVEAFYGCDSLRAVTIPNSVTSIGDMAFYYCSNLSSIHNYATTPATLGNYVFEGVNKPICTLYVPNGYEVTYRATDVWKDFYIVGFNPTGCENLSEDDSALRKVFIGGQLYILLPNGTRYDTTGRLVE